MFEKPIFTYIGMVLAVIAMALGVIKPDWAVFAWTVAGILGFGSVAALRTMIDSKGWKTYAIFVVVGIGALLQIFGVITPDTFQMIMVVFAPITGLTMQNALAKSPTSTVPAIKKAA